MWLHVHRSSCCHHSCRSTVEYFDIVVFSRHTQFDFRRLFLLYRDRLALPGLKTAGIPGFHSLLPLPVDVIDVDLSEHRLLWWTMHWSAMDVDGLAWRYGCATKKSPTSWTGWFRWRLCDSNVVRWTHGLMTNVVCWSEVSVTLNVQFVEQLLHGQ